MGLHPHTCGKTRWGFPRGGRGAGRLFDAHVVCSGPTQGSGGDPGTLLGRRARLRFPLTTFMWSAYRKGSQARVEGFWGSNWAPTESARVLETEVRGTTSSLPAHSIRERFAGKLAVVMDVRVRRVAQQRRVAMFADHFGCSGALAEAQQFDSFTIDIGRSGLCQCRKDPS